MTMSLHPKVSWLSEVESFPDSTDPGRYSASTEEAERARRRWGETEDLMRSVCGDLATLRSVAPTDGGQQQQLDLNLGGLSAAQPPVHMPTHNISAFLNAADERDA